MKFEIDVMNLSDLEVNSVDLDQLDFDKNQSSSDDVDDISIRTDDKTPIKDLRASTVSKFSNGDNSPDQEDKLGNSKSVFNATESHVDTQ